MLVVEDDPEVRCLLQREIADLGHPVTAVGSAEEALGALAGHDFAVVITDIRMPGMDGVQLAQHVKKECPDTEVILVTGFGSVASASAALRLGVSDYLVKPLGDISRIHDSLERALSRREKRLATRRRISQLEAHRETLIHLIDRLPMGVLLLDSASRVLIRNAVADTICSGNAGLFLGAEGRLRVDVSKAGGAELRELLNSATRPTTEGRRVGGATTLSHPSGVAPLSVLVSPLGDLQAPVPRSEPAAAVFVSDPAHRVETTEELLGRLYGVTLTEAKVAAVLMQGRAVEEAATVLGISVNTARTHLKHIFSKTATTRQGDLISLLLSGPALLRLKQDD